MNTGTYYVYEYNGSTQMRNLGFFKITCSNQVYHFRLCIRGITVARHDTLPLYSFRQTDSDIDAYPIENVICENHSISTTLEIPLSRFPEQISLDNIDGFFLPLSEDTVLAAHSPKLSFDSHAIHFCTLSDAKPKETPPQEEPPVPIPPSSNNDMPNKVQKIQRTDLSRLPRRYWNLANNSFLLHGYHNYNHLLLVEEDGHYILGIPGIKDKYEARVAKMFGFPSFSTEYSSQLLLTDDEKEDTENFGYWCCIIPKIKDQF